jgi:hypothetical protein
LSETNQLPTPQTIKPISLSLEDEETEVLKKAFYSGRLSPTGKDTIQKKLGGTCVICGGLAQKIASYDCAGFATRIERYCDSCVKKTFARSEKVGT